MKSKRFLPRNLLRCLTMITDTEIKLKGLEALISALDEVQAERFISLIMRESFDYTAWQRTLWSDKTVKEISELATLYRQQNDSWFNLPSVYYSTLMSVAYGKSAKEAALDGQIIKAKKLEEIAAK